MRHVDVGDLGVMFSVRIVNTSLRKPDKTLRLTQVATPPIFLTFAIKKHHPK